MRLVMFLKGAFSNLPTPSLGFRLLYTTRQLRQLMTDRRKEQKKEKKI
jgi:hypothetical protein